jgi:hypothetical protein
MSTSIGSSLHNSGYPSVADRLIAQRAAVADDTDQTLNAALDEAQEAVSIALDLNEGRKQWARDEVEMIKRQTYDMAVIQLLDPEQYAHAISGLADRLEGASNAYAGSDTTALEADSDALAQQAEELEAAQNPSPLTAREKNSESPRESRRENPSDQLARYSQAMADSDPDQTFSDQVSSLAERLRVLFDLAQDKAKDAGVPKVRRDQAETKLQNSLDHIGASLSVIAKWGTQSSSSSRTMATLDAAIPLNLTI